MKQSVATARLYPQTLEKSAQSVENLGLRHLLLLSLSKVRLAKNEERNESVATARLFNSSING
jgi:hypothetical protein